MFQSSLDEVLHEVDDLDQEPGDDEIREYAELIGIDAQTEPELLWIARAGITAPLPADWKPIQVNNGDELYFYNFKTGESSWEHPSDDKYRQLVIEERKKSQKPKGGGMLPPAKIPAKPQAMPSPSAAAAATAALKPLKQPPPAAGGSAVGKLAPIGGPQSNSANGPPGKLQPIGPAATATAPAPKPGAGKTLTPISGAKELERPKTSRGPTEKEKPPEPQTSQKPTVLGGGSRFLKKNEDASGDTSLTKDANQRNIVQNVLRFPTEDESDLESSSSINSDSLSLPGAKKESVVSQNLVLDLDELKPAADAKPPVPANPISKPPVGPKTPATVAEAKSQAPEPAKQPTNVAAPVDKPKAQPAAPPTIVNETPRKISSDASESVEKVEKQLQEDYERRVKQLREQHDAKLKDVRSKFEEEEKKETEKIKKAMEDRIRSFKEKLHKDEESETKSLTSSHKKQMDDLRSKFEKERVEMEKDFRSKTQSDQEEMENERQRINTADSRNSETELGHEKNRLESEHRKALDTVKKNFEKELAEEERRHDIERKRRVDELRDQLQKELDEWHRKEKERKTAMLKNDIDKELAEVRKNLEAERRRVLEEEVSRDAERHRRNMDAERERQLAEIRKDHETELNRMKRNHKESIDHEIASQQRQTDRIRGEAFDDLRERQEEALKTAELQLKSFRDELSALTRMTVDIRQTLQPTIADTNPSNHTALPLENGKHSAATTGHLKRKSRKNEDLRIDPAKAAVVKSIDDLLSPDVDGERTSRTTSSIGQKLDGLESDDVLEKVTRFLESQKANGARSHHRTSSLQRRSPAQRDELGRIGGTLPVAPTGATRSMNGSLVNLQSNLTLLADRLSAEPPQRRENIFRIQPKDAVDEFLDRKVKEYLRVDNFTSVRERSLWPSAGASSYQNRFFTNGRRGYDVESELNSLKRWLNDFETRISDKSSVTRSRSAAPRSSDRNGILPIESGAVASGVNAPNQVISFLNEEETVEI